MGTSQTRDQSRVACLGRQVLNPWTTRGVCFFSSFSVPTHPLSIHTPIYLTVPGQEHYWHPLKLLALPLPSHPFSFSPLLCFCSFLSHSTPYCLSLLFLSFNLILHLSFLLSLSSLLLSFPSSLSSFLVFFSFLSLKFSFCLVFFYFSSLAFCLWDSVSSVSLFHSLSFSHTYKGFILSQEQSTWSHHYHLLFLPVLSQISTIQVQRTEVTPMFGRLQCLCC